MSLHIGEIVLILAIVALVFGIGTMPNLGELWGRIRHGYKEGRDPAALDVTSKAPTKSEASAPLSADKMAGPVEDADIVS